VHVAAKLNPVGRFGLLAAERWRISPFEVNSDSDPDERLEDE
jgi:hypothetical protein